MATDTMFFKGKARYLQVRRPSQLEMYEAPVYLEGPEMEKFKTSGLALKIREDEDGKEYVTFKRRVNEYNGLLKEWVVNGPPELKVLTDGEWVGLDPEVLVGNGSEVVVKIEVYDTPKRGEGTKGHRLLSVGVTDLIEYKPKDIAPAEYPF